MFYLNTYVCKVSVIVLALFAFSTTSTQASPRHDIIAGPVHGEVLDVLDGDTVSVRLHVWIGQNVDTYIRINGIDTPEIRSRCKIEKEKAINAKTEIQKLLKDNTITLYNIRLAKYAGRVLADTENSDGVNLADHMIEHGLARRYQGKKRQSWCS